MNLTQNTAGTAPAEAAALSNVAHLVQPTGKTTTDTTTQANTRPSAKPCKGKHADLQVAQVAPPEVASHGGVYMEPRRAALLTSACDEIEQLTRVLGTLGNSIDSELVRRSVAVRVHDLNRVVHGVLTESEINPFDMKRAGVTVYGPAWWGVAA